MQWIKTESEINRVLEAAYTSVGMDSGRLPTESARFLFDEVGIESIEFAKLVLYLLKLSKDSEVMTLFRKLIAPPFEVSIQSRAGEGTLSADFSRNWSTEGAGLYQPRPTAWATIRIRAGLKARSIDDCKRDSIDRAFSPAFFFQRIPRPLAWAGITRTFGAKSRPSLKQSAHWLSSLIRQSVSLKSNPPPALDA